MDFLSVYNFYFELPLYHKIDINDQNRAAFIDLYNFKGNVDGYNPELKENTTYLVTPLNITWEEEGINYTILTCVRTGVKFYFFLRYSDETGTLQKVGQSPSIATFHINRVKKYNKVLNEEKMKEFTRAIGLAANGVGIGSFVYLRRIFESLIEDAHIKAKKAADFDNDRFQKQRMAEKIGLLSSHLPNFLVENKSLYSILSLGIHELTESDCLRYYDTVRLGIELILDEKVEEYEKTKK